MRAHFHLTDIKDFHYQFARNLLIESGFVFLKKKDDIEIWDNDPEDQYSYLQKFHIYPKAKSFDGKLKILPIKELIS